MGMILYIQISPIATNGFSGSFFDLLWEAGPVVKGVLLILFGFSVLSWAILVDRYRMFRRSEAASDAFLDAFSQTENLTSLLQERQEWADSPVAAVFHKAYGAARGKKPGGSRRSRPMRLYQLERLLSQIGSKELQRLGRNLNFLATTGSVTPFIGLFGTVWGIMKSFRGIGLTGSASLAAVAPGISEALVATAFGLAAAIPAVIGYNHFLHRLQLATTELEGFTASLLNAAEEQEADPGTAPQIPATRGIG